MADGEKTTKPWWAGGVHEPFYEGGLPAAMGISDWRKRWASATRTMTPTAPTPWWEMTPEEVEEAYYDLSQEPHELPEGYHWEVVSFDDNMMPTQPHWGRVPDEITEETPYPINEPMSEYQQSMMELNWAQQGLAAQQFAWQKGQAGQGESPTQQELYNMFERWRQDYISGGGPSQWINQYISKHMPNPYEKKWKTEYEVPVRELTYTPPVSGEATGRQISTGEPQIVPKGLSMEGIMNTVVGKETIPRITKKPVGKHEYPEFPKAPAWLKKFVPGLTAGEEISKQKMRTPSGQQWAKTPWTQREMLSGYGEWAGQPLIERLEHMQRMQPKTPSGTARKRWSVAKQWV